MIPKKRISGIIGRTITGRDQDDLYYTGKVVDKVSIAGTDHYVVNSNRNLCNSVRLVNPATITDIHPKPIIRHSIRTRENNS